MRVSSAFEVVQPVETSVIAVAVEQKAYPLLWDRITKIAAKLGARPPDAVLLGLSPTFFATAATVRLTGTPTRLTGESLYLSLPLMRLMSHSEFDAVLGHELGHFLGEDTSYTLRFVPVYQGFARAVLATEAESARDALALLPARVVLRYTLSLFARAERAIGREREIAADRCGASVASGDALVGALTKTTFADAAWNRVMMSEIAYINRRTPIENLGQAFVECRQLLLVHHAFCKFPSCRLVAGGPSGAMKARSA